MQLSGLWGRKPTDVGKMDASTSYPFRTWKASEELKNGTQYSEGAWVLP